MENIKFTCKIVRYRNSTHQTVRYDVLMYATNISPTEFVDLKFIYKWFACVLQAKMITDKIEFISASYKDENTFQYRINKLKNKERAARSNYTKWNNRIETHRKKWNKLFDFETDEKVVNTKVKRDSYLLKSKEFKMQIEQMEEEMRQAVAEIAITN